MNIDYSKLPLPAFLTPYMPLIVGLAVAIVIFVVGWVLSKWANAMLARVLRKRNVDESLTLFLGAVAQYTVLAAAVIASLQTVGLETTSLLAVLGSVGIAVGLALQGSLGHVASGVMILFFRPFSVGDVVKAGGETGGVEEIGLFATTLMTANNEKVIVPNGAVTGGVIYNYTVAGTRRGGVDVGVAYGSDVAKVIPLLEAAAAKADLVLAEPGVTVAFVGLGASSLDFKVLAWSKSEDHLGMMHNVRIAVYDELNAAGIDIPFNQIVVHQAA